MIRQQIIGYNDKDEIFRDSFNMTCFQYALIIIDEEGETDHPYFAYDYRHLLRCTLLSPNVHIDGPSPSQN